MLADINGDGLKDIVTGKRFWAHGPTGDVNPNDPAVLYWYELTRTAGSVKWVRHLIDSYVPAEHPVTFTQKRHSRARY